MTNPLSTVINYFPTGTAEGDRDILEKVFIYTKEFSNIIAPPPGSPHLFVGSKGSGKTAVLHFSRALLSKQEIPNIILTPFDIDTSEMELSHSTGDLARSFYTILLDAIILQLSQIETDSFPPEYRILIDNAALNGQREPSFLGKAKKLVAEIAKPVTGIDLNAALPHLLSSTRDEIGSAVQKIVGRESFYVFLDDTDQVARPGVPGHLNRVWALLLAARKLAFDIRNLNIIISLRSEVWERLQRDDYGQRDQTDHFRRLVVKMESSKDQVGKIIDRRLSLAAADLKLPIDGYEAFFQGSGARPPTSQQTRTWRDLILVRTRERPRDAIQLINELSKKAMDGGYHKIDEPTFHSVMPPFSKSISEQFAEEVRQEFPEALEYLRSFANLDFTEGAFTLSADDTKDHFKRMLSRFGGTLNGSTLSQQAPDSVFLIWRFFYQAGVINARISDSSQKKGFRHLSPDTDPFLVSRTRWNEMQGILWEINAVYRDFLIEIQNVESLKSGLARKPTRRR